MSIKQACGLRHNPDQFFSYVAAERWAYGCIKLHLIVLGDNGKYWVCCPADAQRLSRQGLEIA